MLIYILWACPIALALDFSCVGSLLHSYNVHHIMVVLTLQYYKHSYCSIFTTTYIYTLYIKTSCVTYIMYIMIVVKLQFMYMYMYVNDYSSRLCVDMYTYNSDFNSWKMRQFFFL